MPSQMNLFNVAWLRRADKQSRWKPHDFQVDHALLPQERIHDQVTVAVHELPFNPAGRSSLGLECANCPLEDLLQFRHPHSRRDGAEELPPGSLDRRRKGHRKGAAPILGRFGVLHVDAAPLPHCPEPSALALVPAHACRVSGRHNPAASIRHAQPEIIAVDSFMEVERSEEHTSELQSLAYLVCRLLLEKKKNDRPRTT